MRKKPSEVFFFFAFDAKKEKNNQMKTWQYGAEILYFSGLYFSMVLRQRLARFRIFVFVVVFSDISVQICNI